MFNLKKLSNFLVKAKKSGYASGESSKDLIEKDTSTSLYFTENDYKYHDNYFGGEPYGGREVVFFKNKAIYIMTYYGSINDESFNIKEVYKILQKALLLIPKKYPYRGPKKYVFRDYIYINKFKGELDNFSGEELIKYKNKIIYKAKYIGGLINQRK